MAVFNGSNKVYDQDSKDSQRRHMLDRLLEQSHSYS